MAQSDNGQNMDIGQVTTDWTSNSGGRLVVLLNLGEGDVGLINVEI